MRFPSNIHTAKWMPVQPFRRCKFLFFLNSTMVSTNFTCQLFQSRIAIKVFRSVFIRAQIIHRKTISCLLVSFICFVCTEKTCPRFVPQSKLYGIINLIDDQWNVPQIFSCEMKIKRLQVLRRWIEEWSKEIIFHNFKSTTTSIRYILILQHHYMRTVRWNYNTTENVFLFNEYGGEVIVQWWN